jgi:hypothetical protein
LEQNNQCFKGKAYVLYCISHTFIEQTILARWVLVYQSGQNQSGSLVQEKQVSAYKIMEKSLSIALVGLLDKKATNVFALRRLEDLGCNLAAANVKTESHTTFLSRGGLQCFD